MATTSRRTTTSTTRTTTSTTRTTRTTNAAPKPLAAAGRIEALLFDLDGTLVDALSAWDAAFSEVFGLAATRYPALRVLGDDGTRIHREVFRPLIHAEHRAAGSGEWSGDFLRRGFVRLLAEYAQPDEAFAAQLHTLYAEAWPPHAGVYPEVPALLEQLRGRYRLAIVSNGAGPEQRLKIAPLGLDADFPVVAISGELGVRKPAAAIFEHVLAELEVPPARAIHVGDDRHADIEGARAAGLAAAVWVNRHGATVDDGASAPDAEITSVAELPALLGLPAAAARSPLPPHAE